MTMNQTIFSSVLIYTKNRIATQFHRKKIILKVCVFKCVNMY